MLPVDPRATEGQRKALEAFVARHRFAEQDLSSPSPIDRAILHTTISTEERNRLSKIAFDLGTQPANLIRGLIRSVLKEHASHG